MSLYNYWRCNKCYYEGDGPCPVHYPSHIPPHARDFFCPELVEWHKALVELGWQPGDTPVQFLHRVNERMK